LAVLQAEVLTVRPGPWPLVVRTQGSLVADEVAVIGARVAGRVADVHVDLGDIVRAQAPLVTLDRAEFQLQVSQAEAQLAQARAAVGLGPDDPVEKLDPKSAPPVREEKAVWDEAKAKSLRWQQLRAQNAVTETDYEQVISAERVAEARYSSALNSVNEKIALIGVRAAELALAKQRLEDAVIVTPFDGLVQQRRVAPGTFVQVGNAIATLVRSNPLRFRGTMPERHAQHLALGQQVRLHIESETEPRVAEVTRISPVLDELSRALLFEARVENNDGRLRTGLFAEAEVVLDPAATSIVVPASSLVEFAGAEKVWKVVDGAAREQIVQTGQRRPDGVEVVSGLSAGDVILRDAGLGRVARIEPLPSREVPATVSAQDTERDSGAPDASAVESHETPIEDANTGP
jgi:RND family efflux transporter MFP subunit